MSAPTYSAAISEARNYQKWIVSAFDGFIGRRVLEVGFGHGEYSRLLPPTADYTGVDIDQRLVDQARGLRGAGRYLQGDVSSPSIVQTLGAGRFDTIICFNVLEHIPNDGAAVEHMVRLLCAGGHLLLFVPAMPVLYGDLDRLAGHHRRYTLDSLERLVPREMAEMRKLRYFNSIGAVGWFLNRFAKHRSLDASLVERQIKVFDRVVCPIAKVVDLATHRVFGQSIVAAMRRYAF